jgi:magnesium-transporting ATPase (P-type)
MATTTTQTASKDPKDPKGFKPFEPDGESIHHPPWFTYSLAGIGVLVGIGGNLWQVFTSVIAFFNMFVQGYVYKHMAPSAQGNATAGALAVSIGMAIAFQLGVMFFVFRVHKEYKEQKVKVGDNMQAVKTTAVQMVAHHRLLLAWSVLSFLADTVGDFTFITLLTNDPFMLLGYTLSLYAVSTILLSASLERHWAAKIALENWRAFKAFTRLLQLKVQAAHAKQQEEK